MCTTCGCGMPKNKHGMKSLHAANKKFASKKADKKQDAKVMKGMSPKQKAAFGKEDAKMDAKKPSAKEDEKLDKALAKKIKKK